MPFDGKEYQTNARKMQAVLRNGGGWNKGAYARSERNWLGNETMYFCLLGALNVAVNGNAADLLRPDCPEVELLADAVVKCGAADGRGTTIDQYQFGDARTTVAAWNDDERRTFLEIDQALNLMHDMELSALVETANAV